MTKRMTIAHIKLKRAYEPASADDGTRILIDRLWPRGIKKTAVALKDFISGRQAKRKTGTAHR